MLEGCRTLREIESRLEPELGRAALLGQIPLSEPDAELLRRLLRDKIAHDFAYVREYGPLAFSRFLV